MPALEPPALGVPRPALNLLEAVGYGKPTATFDDFDRAARKPRSTVGRYLRALTRRWLVLHVGYDEYAIPHRATLGRLLVEPDPYVRSVLVHDAAFALRNERQWAFACLPVRDALDFEIDRAIPVLAPDERLARSAARPYADAAWFAFRSDAVRRGPLRRHAEGETDAPSDVEVPVLDRSLSLAMLAATGDPRLRRAVRAAAAQLRIDHEDIVRQARRFHIQRPPLRTRYPNALVFPRWLERFWDVARTQALRETLRTEGETAPSGPGAP